LTGIYPKKSGEEKETDKPLPATRQEQKSNEMRQSSGEKTGRLCKCGMQDNTLEDDPFFSRSKPPVDFSHLSFFVISPLNAIISLGSRPVVSG
jgi:hypothetical protein